MNALVFNLSSRYTFPSESTTCQCGSGVSGTTKSSDNVRTLFPSFVLWVTVPLLAFGPWNCDEVCEPLCANEPEAAIPNAVTTRATTIAFKMRDIFMNLPLFRFRRGLSRLDLNRKRFTDAFFCIHL